MRTRIDCCEHCIEERYPGCGAKCKDYKEQKAELEATKAFIKSKRTADEYSRDNEYKRKEDRVKHRQKTSGYGQFRNK